MMMSPGTAPLIQPPNAGQPRTTQPASQPPPAPASAAPLPAAIAATLPMPAAGPIAEAAAAAAAKKPAALKATMLGTGEGLGNIVQKLAQPQPQQPAAPEPQAAPPAAAAPPPAPAPMPAPQPAAVTRREAPPQEDDSKRFLVGDPMAPAGTSSIGGKPQRGSRLSTDIPKDRSATFIVVGIIGVCVIAALGYAAARLLGIAN
jgi:hypothetical protein